MISSQCPNKFLFTGQAGPPWVTDCYTNYTLGLCNELGIDLDTFVVVLQRIGLQPEFRESKSYKVELASGQADGLVWASGKKRTNTSLTMPVFDEKPMFLVHRPTFTGYGNFVLFQGFTSSVWLNLALMFMATKIVECIAAILYNKYRSVEFAKQKLQKSMELNNGLNDMKLVGDWSQNTSSNVVAGCNEREINLYKPRELNIADVGLLPNEDFLLSPQFSFDSVKISWSAWSFALTILLPLYKNMLAIGITKGLAPPLPFTSLSELATKVLEGSCQVVVAESLTTYKSVFPFRYNFTHATLHDKTVWLAKDIKALVTAYVAHPPTVLKTEFEMLEMVSKNPSECVVGVHSSSLVEFIKVQYPDIVFINIEEGVEPKMFSFIYSDFLPWCVKEKLRVAFSETAPNSYFRHKLQKSEYKAEFVRQFQEKQELPTEVEHATEDTGQEQIITLKQLKTPFAVFSVGILISSAVFCIDILWSTKFLQD